jgi:hypothetical protein
MKVANKYIFFQLVIILVIQFFLPGCENVTENEELMIEQVNFAYNDSDQTIYITAKIDQEEAGAIDSVSFNISKNENGDYAKIAQGLLNDDGEHGDIIPNNGEYTYQTQKELSVGQYKCNVRVIKNGVLEDSTSKKLEVFGDLSPSIELVDSTLEFVSGDLLIYKIKVDDPHGIDNIRKVFAKLFYPENQREPTTLNPWNDGTNQDEKAGDDIYTLALYSQDTKIHGMYRMEFWAVNKDNYYSDTISIQLRNPWLELVNPNGETALTAGSSINIKWNSILVDSLKIEYTLNYMDEQPDYELIGKAAAETSSYNWNIPDDLATDSALVKLTSLDNERVWDVSDHFITIE